MATQTRAPQARDADTQAEHAPPAAAVWERGAGEDVPLAPGHRRGGRHASEDSRLHRSADGGPMTQQGGQRAEEPAAPYPQQSPGLGDPEIDGS